MAKIIWSNLALDDLRAIHEYVSQDSPLYAERLIDRIIARVDILEKHSRIGRVVREFNQDNIRELIEGNYRIIYRIETEDKIGIARVHHSARLLKNL
jgi:addiction module RelE/StbE family toxin